MAVGLFVATKKGAWILKSDGARRRWDLTGPIFLGHIVHHLVLDPRDRRTLLWRRARAIWARRSSARPTSARRWKEAAKPPAFPKAAEGESAAWSITCSGSRPATRASRTCGTREPRRRRSSAARTAAQTWRGVAGLQRTSAAHRLVWWRPEAVDAGRLDPALDPGRPARRDAPVRRLLGPRGGVFESTRRRRDLAAAEPGLARALPPGSLSRVRAGSALRARCTRSRPTCSTSRTTAGSTASSARPRAGSGSARTCRTEVGDIGFPIVLHPRDPDTVWVFPMDGTDVWPRTSPDGKPAVYADARRRPELGAPGPRAAARARPGTP